MSYELRFDAGRVEAELAAGADRAAYLAGEHVLQVSNTMVPIEEATLERSGRVTDPEDGQVTVYYDTPYAVVQHEDLTLQHDAGRSAKYLERAMRGEQDAVAEIMRGELQL